MPPHDSRRPRAARFTLAFCAALLATGLHAQELLTLDHALLLAQERSRQLTAQDSAAASARALAVSAGRRPDATLQVGIDNLPVNGADRFTVGRDFMTMRSVGLMQEFTGADKLHARAARFDREADLAEAQRSLALAHLQRDTAMAWLARWYRERMRELLVTERDEAQLQINAADAAYRGGRGTQVDVFAARSAVAQIEDRIAEIERELANARTQLSRWVGEAGMKELGDKPPLDAVGLNPADLDTALAHHPEIAVMAQREAVVRAEADVARTNRTSDWSAGISFSQRGGGYSNMVSINVSIPLQWDQKNRQDRELAGKLALVEQARDEREEATREHVAEARMVLQSWQSDRERLARYDTALIPLAQERTRAALAAYRSGVGALSPLLEARRSEIDIRLERLRLEMGVAGLWAQLNYLVPAGQAMAGSHP